MPYPELDTERMELLAVIHPDLQNGTYYTPWISMQNRHKLLAVLLVGDMGQNATVDLELHQATDAAGTGAKAIAGKGTTQLTQAGGDGDDACAINLRTEEMDAANAYDWVRARLDCLVANSNAALFILGNVPRYLPVSQAGWTEVVA